MRIFRFIRALFRHIFAGRENVYFAEYIERLRTCNKCEHIDKHRYTCGVCGCKMDVKCKWADSECALGKWKPKNEQASEKKTVYTCSMCVKYGVCSLSLGVDDTICENFESKKL